MSSESLTLASLDKLPAPVRLRELCMANAALDAIIMREWEYRYFSFNAHWHAQEQMAYLNFSALPPTSLLATA